MILRRLQLTAVVVLLSACFLGAGVTQPSGTAAASGRGAAVTAPKAAASPAAANWTWWGCWTQFSAGPCRDISRDPQGNYWICRACGTTGNPGPGKCSQISSATLGTGYWCS